MLTPKEAKELTLEVWRYLRDHPEIGAKYNLPRDLYIKVNSMKERCPLCEYFDEINGHNRCGLCPLKRCDEGSSYSKWNRASGKFAMVTRYINAAKIVKRVKAWEV